jgi:type VI secretion system protein ImpH
VPDDLFIYHGGHFAHFPRSAVGLRLVLGDWLQVPVEIRQFQKQWMYLRTADLTRLGGNTLGGPGNNRLGVTAIAGERIASVENRFRVRVGVLGYEAFASFLPGQSRHVQLSQITRTYAGAAWDFDLQLVLHRDEVPACQLHGDSDIRLGWNSWLISKPMQRDPDDAVFVCDGTASAPR